MGSSEESEKRKQFRRNYKINTLNITEEMKRETEKH